MDVPKIMPAPIPVMHLAAVRNCISGAMIQRTAEMRYTIIPCVNTFFTPRVSAIFPNGTKKTAAAIKKIFVSRLRPCTSVENS